LEPLPPAITHSFAHRTRIDAEGLTLAPGDGVCLVGAVLRGGFG
jgi:hypothetical protein